MAESENGNNPQGSPQRKPPVDSTFTAPPSTRAIALVAIAILVGFLLVMVVDSDSSTGKTASATQSTITTTTVVAADNEQSEESTTTTTRAVANTQAPSGVSVLVLNGSNIAGVAGKVSNAIQEADFETLTPGNDSDKDVGTVVYYKSGFQNDAKQIAQNIVPGVLKELEISQSVKTATFPDSAPSSWDQENLVGANIVVVIGNAGN